jgi:hypothetical protein
MEDRAKSAADGKGTVANYPSITHLQIYPSLAE